MTNLDLSTDPTDLKKIWDSSPDPTDPTDPPDPITPDPM